MDGSLVKEISWKQSPIAVPGRFSLETLKEILKKDSDEAYYLLLSVSM